MADPHGFQKFNRATLAHRPVPLRLMDYREVYEKAPAGQIEQQATRCMDCGVPFCHEGCPLGNIIPEWNDLVRQNRWREAYDRLHATNNFPEFTGRLCPAPCEGACVLGINDDAVAIKDVELAIVERAFEEGWTTPIKPSLDTGMRVAVVGSGPAGLAAAQQLTRAGHAVTVYERDDRLGGLMRYGVPEYKMEKQWIDRRLEQMRAEGTEFRTGISPTAADLNAFDAVILATGTPVTRELAVDGRELNGIYPAMEYLTWQNRVNEGDYPDSAISAKGKKVVIIGGGDTGTDCFGTALRQGAASVTQFDIRPRAPKNRAASTPWPMYPLLYRTATAHEEGEYTITGDESADEIAALGLATREKGTTLGNRTYSVNTVSFHGENGHVTSLRGNEVEVVNGRRQPMKDTDFELDADLVLIALGFQGAERGGLIHELGVSFDQRGRMVRDSEYRAETKPLFPGFKPPVYIAGDNGRGQSLIVWAIAEGRAAAAACDRDLMGESALPVPVTPRSAPLSV
ncbi:glutamate synthase subunit beta [Corynebacterium sp. J010B-136]|uniref:glutamate synthase subunit beta n=1 Tax=Corynebacterium sp. J010B-136 TaxID=2099401 RepID=UPI000CFA71FE|nr:glutamate synthase subunit beta [Corynebacterium sp. J010B-136]PQM75243.1 glutamate synthase [Corynebacterium sp. J010B-136]